MRNNEKEPKDKEKEEGEESSEEEVFPDEDKERINKIPSDREVEEKRSQGEEEEASELEEKREEVLSDAIEAIDNSSSGETLKNLVKLGDKEVFNRDDARLDEDKEKKEKKRARLEKEIESLSQGDGIEREGFNREKLEKKQAEKKEVEEAISSIERIKNKKEKLREEAKERKEQFLSHMQNEGLNKEAAEMIYEKIYIRKVSEAENERARSDNTLVSENKATDKLGRKEDPDLHVSPEEIRKEMELDLKRRDLRENPQKGRKVRIKKESGELEEGWEIIEESAREENKGKEVKVGKPDYTKPEGSGKYKEEKWVDLEDLAEWTFPEDESKVEIVPDNKEEEVKKMEEQSKKRRQEQKEMMEEGAEYEYDKNIKRDVFKITSRQHKRAEKEMKRDFASRTFSGKLVGIAGRFARGVWGFIKTIPHIFTLVLSSGFEKIAKATKQEKDEKKDKK